MTKNNAPGMLFHPAQQQLLKMVNLLKHHHWTSEQLARELAISDRTVRRYLQLLKQEFLAPIVTKSNRYYQLQNPTFELNPVAKTEVVLNATDIRALAAANAVLKESLHPALMSQYEQAIRKIEASAHIDALPPFLNRRYSAAPISHPINNRLDQFFEPIADAMENGKCLKITYAPPHREPQEREIEPYHLRYVEGRWVLYAYCRMRGDLRVFSIPRISAVTILDEPHLHAAEFPIGSILKNMHTIWRAQKAWEIELAISPKVVPLSNLISISHRRNSARFFGANALAFPQPAGPNSVLPPIPLKSSFAGYAVLENM